MKELLKKTTAYRLLQNEAENGRLAHTYLLLLDDERNLREVLLECSKLFFDGSDKTNGRIEKGNFPDCLFFPEAGKTLDKTAVEAIVDESCLSPVEGQNKLFVLDQMQKANLAAQNKLLKSLEEPPEGVHFLMGATTEFPILATVKSRAKILEIPPFSPEDVTACLKRRHPTVSEAELKKYAFASGGSVGKAESLLLGGRYVDLAQKAYACVAAEGGEIVVASRALSTVTEKAEILSLMAKMYRDMLFFKTGQGRYALMQGEKEKLKALSERFSTRSLVYALETVAQAEKEITFNANLAQCVEVALWKIEKEKCKC